MADGDTNRGGKGHWRHAETQETLESVDALLSIRVPALTILYHPDQDRIGEQCRLATLPLGKGAELSRLEPIFSPVGLTRGEPLADARLSRRPVWLEHSDGGGVRIDVGGTSTEVIADGVRVDGVMEIAAERLAGGVVLELAKRFALLLHSLGRAQERTSPMGLVGENEAIGRLRGDILRVTDLPVPILLRGESGTGKELVARAIHDASPRRDRPFVAVNMAAVTSTVAASELFGHVRGAFTGASRDHDGFFARANTGTLFMDEIGDISPELQVMLLRVLETAEIQPVGGSRSRRIDVRLIAATDADLEARTRSGAFRLPLLHRLAGYELSMPALRERRDDIPRLLLHFLRQELDALGEASRLDSPGPSGAAWLPAGLVARLVRNDWPGNVRQLRNVARQLVISSRGKDVVRVDPAVERLLQSQPRRTPERPFTPAIRPAAESEPPAPRPKRKRPAQLSHDELMAALRANQFRLGPTASELGMSRTTLYALIEKSDRIRKARDLSGAEINAQIAITGGDLDQAAQNLEVSKRGLQLRMKELGT